MKFLQRKIDPDQRAAYRVGPEGVAVSAELVLGDAPVPAELIDVSAGGVAVAVDARHAAHVEVGASALVCLNLEGHRVSALGEVRSSVVDDGRVRLGLCFADPDALQGQLEPRHRSLLNRRRAFRECVSGPETGLLRARLKWGGKTREHVLHDLSTTGMSIRVPAHDAVQFPADEVVRVQFSLPEDEEPFVFGVLLVHDTPVRGSRRIGFRFEPTACPRLAHDQERILRYILGRQRALQQLRRA